MKNIVQINKNLRSESAIIIAGGPSVNQSLDKIKEICKKTIVICPNRVPNGVICDFLVFVDNSIFIEKKKNILNEILVFTDRVKKDYSDLTNEKWLLERVLHKKTKKIEIDEDGVINHMIGGCGFACLYVAYFLKMKEIYLFGFDGPNEKNEMWHHDGACNMFSSTRPPMLRKLFSVLLNFLREKEIKLYVDKNSPLWGIDKKEHKIIEI
ncbi:MAG TPA: 6-hydroxymethylpterin diphosphokinase MptE-like protein [Candidatus Paceibacterota bacterium]|nr:6-hydroxymethylpterin diphosphokinase MptE-like protein [Candidatus Paceibacterota bacterium]